MTRSLTTLTLMLTLSLPSSAAAALLSYDFRDPSFDPGGTHVQWSKTQLPGGPDITFESVGPNVSLYWDTEDGIGVRGPSYSQDEVEGPAEELRLTFAETVVVGVLRLTDLFTENEFIVGGMPPCYIHPWPTCYRERGAWSTDQGATWTEFLADPQQIRWLTNGELIVPVGGFTTSIWLRAPGAITVLGFPYRQLHEFSLAGIDIKTFPQAVPEPATLTLLGAGLLLARRMRRV